MGEDIERDTFSPNDRRRYREKLGRSLQALEEILRDACAAPSPASGSNPRIGLEFEVNLIDADLDPSMNNDAILTAIDDPRWQSELGRFNIEVNAAPRDLAAGGLRAMSAELHGALTRADTAAASLGTRLLLIGILPTLRPEDLGAHALSDGTRYAALNEQILTARGEPFQVAIEGRERLELVADSVAPEAACTSAQIHVDTGPREFAAYWNAAQAIAGVQLAVGANSPLLFGRRLWAETRVPLFEQSTDTRSVELIAQGVRPRVWFSERWINSGHELFEENVRYFPALLPICDDEEPLAALAAGEVPTLSELCLHNGTIYRWNRPVYAVLDGAASLRVENRVLPSGPTIADTIANAAFCVGLIRGLAEAEHPVWERMPYAAAWANFRAGARDGIAAQLQWPGRPEQAAPDLIRAELLPIAADGLDAWGVSAAERDEVLSVIEARCARGVNGASWQLAAVDAFEARGLDRSVAVRAMTGQYWEHMHTGAPVHTWPLPR
ncbi:MAG: glutamate--cysteine ligase [Sporichthyaceae bacterium]